MFIRASLTLSKRCFSTSAVARANRAIVYKVSDKGNPEDIIHALTYSSLPKPPAQTLNIRFKLSPINPADINVIQGAYPGKPEPHNNLSSEGLGSEDEPVKIGGNEGVAEVTDVGDGVASLKPGDRVVMVKQQSGTWRTAANVKPDDVVKIPTDDGLIITDSQAATITVNPPTALNMLRDFVALKPGDWVIQNGANSAVGQYVIQIAAYRGLKTINLVRDRDNIAALRKHLMDLGATQVLTYDEIENSKSIRPRLQGWTSGNPIQLGLNCVSGRPTTSMCKLLGQDAHLVSYGAMSKQPLELPTSLFIFKNLTSHGFWQTRWYQQRGTGEREVLLKELAKLITDGRLQEPEHEIVSIPGTDSDADVTTKVRSVFSELAKGKYGRKILLRFENVD